MRGQPHPAPDVLEMFVDEREKLRQERDRSSRGCGPAAADSHGFEVGSHINVPDS